MTDRDAKRIVLGCAIVAGVPLLLEIAALLGALFGLWDLRW
jgi:hypothetical protein